MKVNINKHLALLIFAKKGILPLLVAIFFSLPAFSQNLTPAEEIGDLSGIKWKATTEIYSVIDAEKSKMTLALSRASLASDEQALYKAYQRLLTYLQAEIQAGHPLDAAIVKAYEIVLSDAANDPEIKNLPEGHLITFVPGLLEVLQEVQTPKPETAN